jgi:translation elongation factor EF-4
MSLGCGTREHGQHGVLFERSAGSVSIPQEAFIAALRMGDDA